MDDEKKCMYYRVTDPLENLKIGINIREGARIKRDGEQTQPFSEQRVISWQEKIHGPAEVSRYLKLPQGATPKSVSERETVRQLRLRESKGTTISSLLQPVMLHTYVQKDNHIEHTPPSVADSRGVESYVGAAVSRTSHFDATRGDVDPRSVRVENRLLRDKPYKVMYICLAHGVDVAALSSKHGLWDDSFYYKNAVLCEIRLHSDGLLEMYPGFSEKNKEGFVGAAAGGGAAGASSGRPRAGSESSATIGAGDGSAESTVPTGTAKQDVFMDNQTILGAFKSGFRLQTYTIRTPDGGLFEYSLENLNDAPLVESLAQHMSDFAVRPIKGVTPSGVTGMAAANAGAGAGAGGGSGGPGAGGLAGAADMSKWKQDGPARGHDYTATVYAEIVSGSGFEGRRLQVSYQVLCPQGWTLRKGNLTDGVVAGDLVAQYRSRGSVTGAAGQEVAGSKGGGGGGGGMAPSGSDAQLLQAVNNMDLDRESEGSLQGSTHLAVNAGVKGRYSLGSGSAHGGRRASSVHGNSCDKLPGHFGMLSLGGMDETTRCMLGLSFFVVCCLAVVLGIEYPFWVLPGLVVVLLLGDGMPGGGDVLVMNEAGGTLATSAASACGGEGKGTRQHASLHQHANHGLSSRVLQVAANAGVTDPEAHFNHAINLSFDVSEAHDPTCAEAAGAPGTAGRSVDRGLNSASMGSAATAPTVVFEVHSIGWFGRVTLEGYGYTHIPQHGSTGVVEIKTWKPVGTLASRLYNLYCGGGSQLHNKVFAGIPNPKQRSLNRFGMVTESSGVLRFRANVLTADPRRIVRIDHEEANRKAQTQRVRKTVDDILHNFKATGTVSSASVTSTLLRASTQSNLFASMNAGGGDKGAGAANPLLSASAALNRGALARTMTHGSLGTPKAGGGGGVGGLKAVVTDNSSVNSRVADIIARAKAAKTSSAGAGTAGTGAGAAAAAAVAAAAAASASATAVPAASASSARPDAAVAKAAAASASATAAAPFSEAPPSRPRAQVRMSAGIVDEDDDEDDGAEPVNVRMRGQGAAPAAATATASASAAGAAAPGGSPPRGRGGRYNNALRDSGGSDA